MTGALHQPKVVTVSGDPGGSRALVPVIKALGQQGLTLLENLAYFHAGPIYRQHGVSSRDLLSASSFESACNFLRDSQADLLVTATSHNGVNWEKAFLRAARALGVTSLSVLDFWSNYSLRFSDEAGHLSCMADVIAIMDDFARSEMILEGFPPSCLAVTGQPVFETLPLAKRKFLKVDREITRRQFGFFEGENVIAFVSQPFRELFGNRSSPGYLGFDQHQVLSDLLTVTDEIAGTSPATGVLVLLHPRESLLDFSNYTKRPTKVVLSAGAELRRSVMASDLVVGMNSIALVEACLLGRKVISYQPGLVGSDSLPTNRWGGSFTAKDRTELAQRVCEQLSSPLTRQHVRKVQAQSRQICLGSTDKIVQLIYSQLLNGMTAKQGKAFHGQFDQVTG